MQGNTHAHEEGLGLTTLEPVKVGDTLINHYQVAKADLPTDHEAAVMQNIVAKKFVNFNHSPVHFVRERVRQPHAELFAVRVVRVLEGDGVVSQRPRLVDNSPMKNARNCQGRRRDKKHEGPEVSAAFPQLFGPESRLRRFGVEHGAAEALDNFGGSLLDRIAAGGAGVTFAGSKYIVRYAILVLVFASGPAAPPHLCV